MSRRLPTWAGLAMLLSVGCQERWTPEEAVLPGLMALDMNGDNQLDVFELQRGSPVQLDFEQLDLDHSQAVELDELLAMVRGTDPKGFDGIEGAVEPHISDGAAIFPDPKRVRTIRVVFQFMADQIHTAAPGIQTPSEEDIHAAARTGSLDSPECRALAREFVKHYAALGLQPPPSIYARASAAAPTP